MNGPRDRVPQCMEKSDRLRTLPGNVEAKRCGTWSRGPFMGRQIALSPQLLCRKHPERVGKTLAPPRPSPRAGTMQFNHGWTRINTDRRAKNGAIGSAIARHLLVGYLGMFFGLEADEFKISKTPFDSGFYPCLFVFIRG